ncbi:MAG TPA: polysaccharide biosynthesis C-terminal domain-containing protein [Smithellaceae bacterium]|nr:polysaccharide biosynthesis C-terminal domain-containing protein [Smithellaceae bacterium]
MQESYKIINHMTVTSLASQGISSLGNFLTVVLLAKALTPDDFGLYMMFSTAFMIVSGISASLVKMPLKVLGAGITEKDASSYFSSQLSLQIIFVFFILLAGGIFLLTKPLFSLGLAAAFFFYLMSADLQDFMRSANMTRFKWKKLFTADIITHVCRITLILMLLWMKNVSLIHVLLIIGITYLAGFLISPLGGVHYQINLHNIANIWRINWKFGKWLLLETILYTVSTQIYIYFIALGVDIFSAGAFAAAQTLLNSFNVVQIGLMNYAIPVARKYLIETGYNEWRRWLMNVGIILFSVSLIFCAVISIFAKPLLSILFKPIYGKFYYLVPILSIAIILVSINTVLSAAFRTAEFPEAGFWGKLVSAIVTIGLGYPMILKWGIIGAGLGIVFTQICWIIVNLSYVFFTNTLREKRISSRIIKINNISNY